MANYEIIRNFPARQPMRRGQIVVSPDWKNLSRLIQQGYVREIGETQLSEIEVTEAVEETAVSPKKKRK